MGEAIELKAVGQRARSGGATLRDVSLSVGRGELVAIIGGIDSGKTALLEVMGGVRPPAAGAITTFSGNIGYVLNEEVFHSILPLIRALGYTAALRGVPDTAVAEALATVGLTDRAHIPVGELTAGERRLAALAAGLLTGPELLFLQEPTSGLDPIGGAELLRLLRDLAKSGKTVVMTTHLPVEAEQSDKVAVLADGGHLAFFGTPEGACDFFGADDLDEIYQRLAGVGDPVAAWSRRFSRFSRTHRALSPTAPLSPRTEEAAPASAPLPEEFEESEESPLLPDPLYPETRPEGTAISGPAARAVASGMLIPGWCRRMPRPLRRWALAAARNADVLSRTRPLAAWLLAGPLVVALVTLTILFRAGPADAGRPLFWVAFSGLFSGLACGLPQVFPERPVLRHDRLAGLGAWSYVLAKAAVLLPPLVVADALFLALLDVTGGQPGLASFVPVYVTLLLCSTTTLGLGLLASAAVPESRWAGLVVPAACFPLLLAAYGIAEGHAGWLDWVILGGCTLVCFAASIRLVSRSVPLRMGDQ